MRQFVIVLFIGISLISGCSKDNSETEISAKQQALQDSLDLVVEQEHTIRSASAHLIGEFAGELRGRLGTAMKNSGPSGAIKECRSSAPEVAEIMSQHGWSIKRVSDKNRNSDNRATLAEKDIMKIFTDTIQPVRKFFGEWTTTDSVETYTYYKPIWVNKVCLKCHGDMQTLGQGVYKTIKKQYPLDKATGYKEGDLRGMFVVKVNWPEGKEFADKLLSGATFESMLPDTTENVDSLKSADSTGLVDDVN